MKRAIFVSYRRDDAEGEAGRLYDDLVRAFGNDSVFIDVAGIAPGIDFRKAIDDNVAACGVFLAVVGPNWVDIAGTNGQRRIENPNDFVRLEIASALARNIPVIPILVRAAGMPTPEQLPESLQNLAYRNAIELSHTRWSFDVDSLIRAIKPYVQTQPSTAEDHAQALPETSETAPSRPLSATLPRFGRNRIAIVTAALCLLLAIYPLYRYLSRPKALLPESKSQPPAAKPIPTQGADEEVAQIQKSLSDAAAGSTAKTSATAAPDVPSKKGPLLVAGDINGTWISASPDPASFASKIVISGTGRYRTLYISGECGKQPFEFWTPDADFIHGILTDTYGCPDQSTRERDSRIYYTMYLSSRGLFMHAERRSDQTKSGAQAAPEDEIGYYDKASASRNAKD